MNLKEMEEHLVKGGFKRPDDPIHVFEGGSHQHGAALPEGRSDIDLYGVYIEPPEQALGVSDETHFTGGNGRPIRAKQARRRRLQMLHSSTLGRARL